LISRGFFVCGGCGAGDETTSILDGE